MSQFDEMKEIIDEFSKNFTDKDSLLVMSYIDIDDGRASHSLLQTKGKAGTVAKMLGILVGQMSYDMDVEIENILDDVYTAANTTYLSMEEVKREKGNWGLPRGDGGGSGTDSPAVSVDAADAES